jgi:hypothetical protein
MATSIVRYMARLCPPIIAMSTLLPPHHASSHAIVIQLEFVLT